MKKDNFFKGIVPPYIFNFLYNIRIFIHRNDCKPYSFINKQKKYAIIIGNGPSLNNTILKYENELKNNDCFMVNHAVETNYFEILKPLYYIVVDEYYFQNDSLNEKSKAIIKSLNDKLKWNIYFFVPFFAKDSLFVQEIKKNELVNVVFLNSILPIYAKNIPHKKMFSYWNKNIACPLMQTVLNTATSVAITLKYNDIYLVGADTSWIEMLIVDQENNDLYSHNKHFYENEKYLISKYNDHESNLAAELGCIKKALESYQILKEYACYNGCHLYNASEYSLIDSIIRKKF